MLMSLTVAIFPLCISKHRVVHRQYNFYLKIYKPSLFKYIHTHKILYPYNLGVSSEKMENIAKNYFFFISKFPGERFNKVPDNLKNDLKDSDKGLFNNDTINFLGLKEVDSITYLGLYATQDFFFSIMDPYLTFLKF